jgi:hypothetical protein
MRGYNVTFHLCKENFLTPAFFLFQPITSGAFLIACYLLPIALLPVQLQHFFQILQRVDFLHFSVLSPAAHSGKRRATPDL